MDHGAKAGLAKRRVLLYFLSLGAFCAIGYLGASVGLFTDRPVRILTCPALAAVAVSLATRRSPFAVGWKPGPIRWLMVAWLLPMAYAGLTYGTVWLAGLGGVPSRAFVDRAAVALGMTTAPAWQVIVSTFGFVSVAGIFSLGALGEEIGWRGLLVPELDTLLGFRPAALISGAVWAVWHWPMIPGDIKGHPGLLWSMSCFSVTVVVAGVIFAWLRLKSGSIWPCVILHATHNAVLQNFFDPITIENDYTTYLTGEFGVGLLIPLTAIAGYCWRRSAEAEDVVTV